MKIPSMIEQQRTFNGLRDWIDYELRNTGFERFLQSFDLDPTVGRLAVACSFEYSTQLADRDPDLDPLAQQLATHYEVGVMAEEENAWYYHSLVISGALDGNPQEPTGPGESLHYVQFVTVAGSVRRLLKAKEDGRMPFLTKSLRKIDLAGD